MVLTVALWRGLLGSKSSRMVKPEQTTTSRGRISRAPRRMARCDPTWAPSTAPSAIANPTGQTTAAVAVVDAQAAEPACGIGELGMGGCSQDAIAEQTDKPQHVERAPARPEHAVVKANRWCDPANKHQG